jgi:hypothetical protein
MKLLPSINTPKAARARKIALVLVVLTLPFFLGAWKITIGRDINPAYVERIQDGKTPKHEILTLFGDPDEIERTPEGLVYIYQSFRNKDTLPKAESKGKKVIQDNEYYFKEDWYKQKKKREAADNKELDRELIIRFDREGETVQGHQYKQF